MSDVEGTLGAMRAVLAPSRPSTIERVRDVSAAEVAASLEDLGIVRSDAAEVARQWDEFRRDGEWTGLLGGLLDALERDRGLIDAPIHIWSDLDDAGANGRFLYFYVFVLARAATAAYLAQLGAPASVIERTFEAASPPRPPPTQVGHPRGRRRLVDAAGLER